MDRLTHADLDRFLRSLARRLPCPVRLVLTGGGEAMLLGGTRPTGDLDFALVVAERFEAHWPAIEAAVTAARDDAGIAVQYATDIDRWSSVSIPAARRRTRAFRRIGRLSIHLVEPTCWAVYKLTRFLDSDVSDLRAVLRRQAVPWRSLARLCGESLRTSPRSTQLRLFRQQVEHFFRTHGGGIWGARFEPERAIGVFRRAAGIPSVRSATDTS
jgi:hypothetical protein